MQTIRELSRLIHCGDVSPSEVAKEMLDQIQKKNAGEHIFITVSEEVAMAQAKQADYDLKRGIDLGPLQGIPYTLKDLFKTAGIRTTGGSQVLADYIPDKDAELVQTLNMCGSVLLGKVNQYEFAHGATSLNPHYGDVCNPYDSTRVAGGSSSGSAAAVAKDYGLFSLGTDTGGSVRVPAALCGLAGLKPTYGLLSTKGIIPYCWSLDHAGVIAHTAEDVKIVMDALLKKPYNSNNSKNLKGIKIGIPDTFFYEDLDPEIEKTMADVQKNFELLGAELRRVSLPDLAASRTASLIIQLPELLSCHEKNLAEKGHLYSDELKAGMAAGQFILAEQYLTAKRTARFYAEEVGKVFQKVDLMLTPSTPCIAPKLDQKTVRIGSSDLSAGNAVTRFFSLFNMTGMPAMTVPAGFHSTGLPIGFQLIGAVNQDDVVMNAAISYENR